MICFLFHISKIQLWSRVFVKKEDYHSVLKEKHAFKLSSDNWTDTEAPSGGNTIIYYCARHTSFDLQKKQWQLTEPLQIIMQFLVNYATYF